MIDRLQYYTLACILLLAAGPAANAQVNASAVTAQGIVREMGYRDARAAHLLAFSAQVDHRPLQVDSALLAIEFTTNTWRLLHVYRHLGAVAARRHRWTPSATPHLRHPGHQDFRRRPVEAEVDGFLRQSRWEFGALDRSFRLVKGEVYADTWRKVLGYSPKQKFPKPAG